MAETTEDDQEWIYVDEDGNEVATEAIEEAPEPEEDANQEWVYVDAEGEAIEYEETADEAEEEWESDESEYVDASEQTEEWVYEDEEEDSDETESEAESDWLYVDENGDPVEFSEEEEIEQEPEALEYEEVEADSEDENEEWIYVDENGNPVEFGEEEPPDDDDVEWVYVDENGNEIDSESYDESEETESPKTNSGSVQLKKADLSHLKSSKKSTAPALKTRSGGGVARKRITSSRSTSRSTSAYSANRPLVVKESPSLWPLFWLAVVILGAGGGFWFMKKQSQSPATPTVAASAPAPKITQQVTTAKQAAQSINDKAEALAPALKQTLASGVKEAKAELGISDLLSKAELVSIDENAGEKEEAPPLPLAKAEVTELGSMRAAAAPAKPKILPKKSPPKPSAPIKVIPLTFPNQGLIARYNSLRQTGSNLFTEETSTSGPVVTWGNSAGDFINENALVPDDLEGEGSPELVEITGTAPSGKDFVTRAVEFDTTTKCSSIDSPFSKYLAKATGASIVMLVRANSTGHLATVTLSPGGGSKLEVMGLGNSIKVAISDDRSQYTMNVPFGNREWRTVFISWDSKTGKMVSITKPLNSDADTAPAKIGPRFEPKFSYVEMGGGARAQFIDLMIFNRPLGAKEYEAFTEYFEEAFFLGEAAVTED